MLTGEGIVIQVQEGHDMQVDGNFQDSNFDRISPKELKIDVGRGKTERRD